MKMIRFRLIRGFVGVALLSGVFAVGQEPVTPVSAPVPSSLLNAKKVFISNAGADSGLFPHPFSGDPDRAYNEFYANVSSWGRYELVATPGEADLVLELQLSAPNGPSNADKSKGASDPLPIFRLVIYEADALRSLGSDGVNCTGGEAKDT
jgi:hypothetical protein